MKIERNAHANHEVSFGGSSRSRLPSGSTVEQMFQFGNVPTDVLVDAVEKHVAKMNEDDLASHLSAAASSMPLSGRTALVTSIFAAFRERGEASEDAAEGANTTVTSLESGDEEAIVALVTYGRENAGVLKEAMRVFAETHAGELHRLPSAFLDGLGERL